MTDRDGGPVHPVTHDMNIGVDPSPGLSVRDYFAAAALTGVMNVCQGDPCKDDEDAPAMFARKAYEIAYAMLAARAKP